MRDQAYLHPMVAFILHQLALQRSCASQQQAMWRHWVLSCLKKTRNILEEACWHTMATFILHHMELQGCCALQQQVLCRHWVLSYPDLVNMDTACWRPMETCISHQPWTLRGHFACCASQQKVWCRRWVLRWMQGTLGE